MYGIVYAMRKERVWMVQTEQQYICIHQCIVCILQQNGNNGDQQELLDQDQQDLELMNNSTSSTMLAHHNRAFEGTSSLMLSSHTATFIVRCGILWLNAAVNGSIPTRGFWSKQSNIKPTGSSTNNVNPPINNKNVTTINTIITTNAYNKSWWSSWWRRKSSSNNIDDIYRL